MMHFKLEIEGNEMQPQLLEGDIITVDTSIEPKTNAKDIAVVEIGGNLHICKLAKFGKQLLMLHDNGRTIPVYENKVTIIGKVIIEHKKSLSAGTLKAIS